MIPTSSNKIIVPAQNRPPTIVIRITRNFIIGYVIKEWKLISDLQLIEVS